MDLSELFERKVELLAVSIEPHDCEPQLQVAVHSHNSDPAWTKVGNL